MPVRIDYQPGHVHEMRFSGVLRRAEFAETQRTEAKLIDAGAQPRLLAILEDFEGWEKGTDWNDLDFMLSHGGGIAKIAIVGEAKWETQALAFTGAGFREAPVQFFPTGQEAQARAWLAMQ